MFYFTWSSVHEGLNEAREILCKNKYPPSFVENIIKRKLNKLLPVVGNLVYIIRVLPQIKVHKEKIIFSYFKYRLQ